MMSSEDLVYSFKHKNKHCPWESLPVGPFTLYDLCRTILLCYQAETKEISKSERSCVQPIASSEQVI